MRGPLVSTAQLAAELASPAAPTVLDVRWSLAGPPGVAAFRSGHIPDAAFVDLDRDLSAPPGAGGRHPLPDPAAFGAAMRGAGVGAERAVVVYDTGDGFAAGRCWWLLRHHGHPSVRVLDGGFAAWAAEGRPLESGDRDAPVAGDFVPSGGTGMRVVDAAGAERLARSGLLLDARAPERYRAEVEPVDAVAGHIPGARNAPATSNVDPATGRFLPATRLAELAARSGVTPGVEVAAYCGSGVMAAQSVLALELAGVPAALYPGSWSDWITDPQRRIATGPDPG